MRAGTKPKQRRLPLVHLALFLRARLRRFGDNIFRLRIRRDHIRAVIRHAIDRRRHRIGLKLFVRQYADRRQRFFCPHIVAIEPGIIRLRRQHHRHAVMHLLQERAGVHRHDGAAFHLLAIRPDPGVPYAGKGERPAALAAHEPWPLRRTLALPFVEAVGGNETAPPLHRVLERGLLVRAFPARIDQQGETLRVLHPGRHQPPAYQCEAALALLHAHDRHRLGRRHVVARGKIRMVGIAEQAAKFIGVGDDEIPPAHARNSRRHFVTATDYA